MTPSPVVCNVFRYILYICFAGFEQDYVLMCSVEIPGSLTSIGNYAFHAQSLNYVRYDGKTYTKSTEFEKSFLSKTGNVLGNLVFSGGNDSSFGAL